MQTNAILALADSSIFRGRAIAATSSRCEASPNLHDMKNPFGRFVMAIKEK